MKRLVRWFMLILVAGAILAGVAYFWWPPISQLRGSFLVLPVPPRAKSAYFTSVNDEGLIAGYYFDGANHAHGFIYNRLRFTNISGPAGSIDVLPQAVSNDGTIAGYYKTIRGGYRGFTCRGTVYTVVNGPPGAREAGVYGINSRCQLVGDYADARGIYHGFVFFRGAYTSIEAPWHKNTFLRGINDSGRIVGYCLNDLRSPTSFSFDAGKFSQILGPGGAGSLLFANDINNSNEVVGDYSRPNLMSAVKTGFLLAGHGLLIGRRAASLIDAPGAAWLTKARAINNNGQIVGQFEDESGSTHGFIFEMAR